MTRAAIALAVVCACHRSPSITSCADDLGGLWRDPSGHTWMILDEGASLEVYPVFDDGVGPAAIVEAPRVIDLARSGEQMTGSVHRQYVKGGDACTASVPARVTACADRALDIVLADPTPPLGFAPCAWGRPEPSRREHWLH